MMFSKRAAVLLLMVNVTVPMRIAAQWSVLESP
jgi:hypothetical protein